MTSLKCLILNDTKVTDAGLAPLKSLKNLRQLHLGQTPVTDQGLCNCTG